MLAAKKLTSNSLCLKIMKERDMASEGIHVLHQTVFLTQRSDLYIFMVSYFCGFKSFAVVLYKICNTNPKLESHFFEFIRDV